MEFIVFLDTNIYESSNFSLHNSKFEKLKQLTKAGTVKLIYNQVIYQEVSQHIQEYIKEAVDGFNNAVANRGFAPFRLDEELGIKIENLDKTVWIDKQLRNWDEYLEQCCAYKIPINIVDVDGILEQYFKKILPFENKKPTEFKDAIAIDSIKKYGELDGGRKIYVVSNDKGFRKSFRDCNNIEVFDNLNKFLNLVYLNSEYWNETIHARIESQDFAKYISNNLEDLIMFNIDLADFSDDFDVNEIELIDYKIGYIDIINKERAEVTLEIEVYISIEYYETDIDNSYFDREEGHYSWENFVKFKDLHRVSFEAVAVLDIDGMEETKVKEKINQYSDLLEGCEEVNFEMEISVNSIELPDKILISLSEKTIIESEIVERTVDSDYEEIYDEEDDDFISYSSYGTPYAICKECGKMISRANDGGNGLCFRCAYNY